jgi:hypothetical protein
MPLVVVGAALSIPDLFLFKNPRPPIHFFCSSAYYSFIIVMKWGAAATVVCLASLCGAGAFTAAPPAAVAPSSSSSRSSSSSTRLYTMLDRRTGKSQLDPAVIDRFASLPFPPGKILAEYVWVDADGNCRSKTRTLAAEKVRGTSEESQWLVSSGCRSRWLKCNLARFTTRFRFLPYF